MSYKKKYETVSEHLGSGVSQATRSSIRTLPPSIHLSFPVPSLFAYRIPPDAQSRFSYSTRTARRYRCLILRGRHGPVFHTPGLSTGWVGAASGRTWQQQQTMALAPAHARSPGLRAPRLAHAPGLRPPPHSITCPISMWSRAARIRKEMPLALTGPR